MSFDPNSVNLKIAKLGLRLVNGKYALGHLTEVVVERSYAPEGQQWCQLHLKDEWVWSSPVHTNWTKFYFKNPDDALAFKLMFAGKVTA